jgi:hypothetical protein|tara:strand:+ start:1173 stop:1472 length:300 start_codon:yes stop_codon:yes gene_type:complete
MKSNVLENPTPVSFTIKMDTDKAYIVDDLTIAGKPFIANAVLPKMYTNITATNKNVTTADVEYWILEQRYNEESQSSNEGVQKLLSLKYSNAELADLPF